MGLRPQEAIMVDNDADFIAAAKEAGLETIYYTVGLDLADVVKKLV